MSILRLNRNKAVKSGWGSRPNFQASYGLGMTQEGIDEGKDILRAMEKAEKEAQKREKQAGGASERTG